MIDGLIEEQRQKAKRLGNGKDQDIEKMTKERI